MDWGGRRWWRRTVEDNAGLVGEVDGDVEGLADPAVVEVAEGVGRGEGVGGGVADVEGVALGGRVSLWDGGGRRGEETYP